MPPNRETLPSESVLRAATLSASLASKYDRMAKFIADAGYPEFRYRQVLESVFRRRVGEFALMHLIPARLRRQLEDEFGAGILSLRRVATRESSQAEKVLYGMRDGKRVEAVALKFRAGWESFCISSQAGCGFACTFCATGKLGLLRNMTADEITDQLLDFHLAGKVIDSVAFMGMGEALSNVHVFSALRLLSRADLFGLSPRRITISTIGIVPQMERLGREFPQVNLTLSLHSPFDDQRSDMMPINRKYPIASVMDALDRHVRLTKRKAYIAYVLIAGVNDTFAHARALAQLVRQGHRGAELNSHIAHSLQCRCGGP